MIGNSFARLTGSKRNLLALMASSAVFTAGCSNMASTAPSIVSPASSPAALGGKIHGGNQPVVGATVKLYYAGQKSGFPPTLGATTTTDAAGSFGFTKDTTNGNPADNGSTSTFSCPTSVGISPLVYVISTGGNTQNNGDSSQNNAAAEFISVFGPCNTLTGSTFIDMTEVTTVATMAAYQGFFDPTTESIAADGTTQQTAIITAIPNTIALLANLATGASVTSTTLSASATGNINPAVTVTATPEPGKVNLLANILSACINTASASSAACTSLFGAATPPNSAYTSNFAHGTLPTATTTLQAIYYLLSNPTSTSGGTSNIPTLFGLAGGVSGPYQPALATQPTDWTIAISFSSTSTCGTASTPGGFISGPIDINIDAADNVWIANSQAASGNLSQISSAGIPTTCVFLGSGGSLGGAVLDSAGNTWFGSGTSLYRYNNGTTLAFPTTVSPIGVTADGLGNVYFTAVSGSVGSLYRIPGAAAAASAVAPVQISNGVGTNPVRLMPDLQRTAGVTVQGNIFVSTGTTSVAEVSPSAAVGNLNGFVTSPISTSGNSYGLSLGPQNNLFVSAIDSGAITGLTASSGYTAPINGGFPFNTPGTIGIATPTSIAVDGRLNVWIPNNANGTGTGSVSELGSQNTATGLSPSTGYQKASTFLTSGRALAVDQAGNVWVAGDGTNFITEIVGGGVPVFQPYALGLKNGRFQAIP
ncbi:hypothetical protein [Tunturiibacter gelidoferens]|uniref:NHL repeat containing protein n=3 Tax=Tunturiibacter TaxID=3154218 RepID=A0A7Y9NMW3_9BACT|nr:hypothetical protein [Edaphobacter lichenicola]MBB5338450.1 hypothetical protein [Edaphobacter lichenicola]NYF52300.1 hypothetical protein [Edaphobacter lichenicola]